MAFNEQPSNPKPDVEATEADTVNAGTPVSARQLIDQAKRHFALKEYLASSDKAAQALEELQSEYAEDASELAPVFHLYGKSLLENFIINSAALGGGGGSAALPAPTAAAPAAAAGSSSKASASSSSAVKNDPRFSFSGDAEDDDDDEEEQAPGAADDDDDDLQVAFSVLDLARVIYERVLSSDSPKLTTLDGQEWDKTRIQAELAEVMNHLGDVGLESENFTQASADYKSSLDILLPLLNAHSRRLADAHLRLGLALEFHPEVEQRKGAKAHVQAASDVLAARVTAIKARIQAIESDPSKAESTTNEAKEKDDLAELTDKAALDKELNDVQEMKKEIDTKLDEYETEDGQAQLNGQPDLTGVLGLPSDANAAAGMSAKDALQQAIKDAFLGAQAEGAADLNPFTGATKSAAPDAPVNNLSSMVKRKKKVDGEDAAANGDEASKKAKTEA